jgi:hypothetical protein
MGGHRLGHMEDTVRDMVRRAPTYRSFLVRLPERFLTAVDQHIVNRVHDGRPPIGLNMAAERDALIELALRFYIDHWPDVGPYATPRSGRRGPAASSKGATP